MKHHRIITTLTSEPLLLVPATALSLLEMFHQHATLSAEEFQATREGVDFCGEAVDLDQAKIEDGIMFIPIGGPIGKGLGKFEKGAGAVDVGDITDELQDAEEDEEVRAVLLVIDSPGGMVNGTPELAEKIAAMEKPIYAYSESLIASAAYWLASATDGIFTTRTANTGSIGVYVPWADTAELYKQMGVKIELFTSGKYKGMGYPGTSLSAAQRDLLNGQVMKIANMFYEHVRSNRPDVEDESMQGQTFMGEEACARGLIDQVVHSIEDVIQLLH